MPASLLPGLALALLYWAVGYPAIHLAIPPGYTAPFFPPAGIALAALFVFGLRLWPAVFAGSALIQLATAWPLLGSPGWSLLGPLAVPVGATLQAVVGVLLARRLLAPGDTLDTAGAVMRFLGVCVPLSGLVCSTIGVSALVWAGVIPTTDALFNWWSWWTGDTLGMLVAAPLTLVFIGRPAQDWRERRLGVALPMSIALVLLALAYQQVVSWEKTRLRAQFERDSAHLSGLLQKRLEEQVDMVRSIERLLLASDHVSHSDFQAFVAPWMQRHPGTRSFTWNRHVPHAARDTFEEAMRVERRMDYRILDRSPAGATSPADERSEYFPVTHVEPEEGNRAVLGMDPLSFPISGEAIRRTLADGQPAATARMRLVQEHGEQHAVVLYQAVFAPAASAAPRAPIGLVSAALGMDDLLVTVSQQAAEQGIAVRLVDRDASPEAAMLAGEPLTRASVWPDELLNHVTRLDFAGRHWELQTRALPQYTDDLRSWAAWGTIAVGVLASGMLGALLLITTGSRRRIQALVERRTGELEAASARLQEHRAALVDAQRIARLGSWETLAAFASADELFAKGSYKATVTWGDPTQEGFGKRCYAGEREFEIRPRQTTEEHITATVANSQVLVRTTEQFRKYFHDARFSVTTGSSNTFEFTFEGGGSDPDQTDPLCVAASTSLAVNGTARRQSATGTDSGREVNFPEQRLEATTPRTRHIFEYDAADAGSATLNIYIGVDEEGNDLLVETRVIEVELNDDSIQQ